MATHLLGIVHIPIFEPLKQCADRLSAALDGVAFVAEESGKYEEVPAYVGSKGDAEFVLFGVPDAESAAEYSLEFNCKTATPVSRLAVQSGVSFLAHVPDDKPRNERGYVDVSPELCAHLNQVDFALGKAVVSG